MIFTQTLTKKQVARLLNISPGTLQTYLNRRYFKELQAIDYKKDQKILTPKQLNYLAQKIDLSTEQ